MSTGMIRISAKAILANARAREYSAEQLQMAFKGMPLHVCQALLDGSAVITEESDDGRFTVYEP